MKAKVYWGTGPRPDGRRFRYRHVWGAASVYVQAYRLEIVFWYRNLAAYRRRAQK